MISEKEILGNAIEYMDQKISDLADGSVNKRKMHTEAVGMVMRSAQTIKKLGSRKEGAFLRQYIYEVIDVGFRV